MTTPVTRPGLVTVLVVLTVIGGALSILAGIIALMAAGGFVAPGLIFILLGLIYLAVAKGLADGNPLSRTIVAVVSAIQIIYAVLQIFSTDNTNIRNSAIGTAVFSIIILAILYSPRANAFFTRGS